MKITVELTKGEELYLCQNCIQRVVSSALAAVPKDYAYVIDLVDLGEYMEPLRVKLVDAIFRARLEEGK